MRVRGLKPVNSGETTLMDMSHPMRVRGLKPHWNLTYLFRGGVAPHAGAWIETLDSLRELAKVLVAPHAGAWIETKLKLSSLRDFYESHPMRVRGLKPV